MWRGVRETAELQMSSVAPLRQRDLELYVIINKATWLLFKPVVLFKLRVTPSVGCVTVLFDAATLSTTFDAGMVKAFAARRVDRKSAKALANSTCHAWPRSCRACRCKKARWGRCVESGMRGDCKASI